MLVHADPSALRCRPRAVTVGTFDGVHTGHRALFQRLATNGLVPTVVTFDPHPRLVLGRPVDLIAPLNRRLELMADAGIAEVLVVRFTQDVARTAPEDWAEQVLRPMGARRVVLGRGFRFGARAAGDAGMLRDLGHTVEEVELQGGASSTRVRQLVAAGEITEAARLLGRPIELDGVTRRLPGDGRLRLTLDAGRVVPPPGTYAGRALGLPVLVTVAGNGEAELSGADRMPAVPPARVRTQLLFGADLRSGRPLVPSAGVALGVAS
ncbi:FAD synthetase family protein [Modestobacter lapidis]|nr:FAD synthetase family protein [Modestobacter lapidis]